MKKIMSMLFVFLLIMTMLVACGTNEEEKTEDTKKEDEKTEDVDAVTTASMVDNGQALMSGLSADGTWIVVALKDITLTEEIIVDGQFYDNDDTSKDIYRKLGLYTNDENYQIVDQFTVTAPKMTVKSENFFLKGGTFVGDIYVEANGFSLGEKATIDGNLYFAAQEYADSFVVDETASVTGAQEVQ